MNPMAAAMQACTANRCRDEKTAGLSDESGFIAKSGTYRCSVLAGDLDGDVWPDAFSVNGHVFGSGGAGVEFEQQANLAWNLGNGPFLVAAARFGLGMRQATSARDTAFGDPYDGCSVEVVISIPDDRPSLLLQPGWPAELDPGQD